MKRTHPADRIHAAWCDRQEAAADAGHPVVPGSPAGLFLDGLDAALSDDTLGKGWCATCHHHYADHHEVDGCGACALAYDRHNPRHDFTPALPVGDG